MNKKIALSFDVDWAPDEIVISLAQLLVSKGVKATWFITHASGGTDFLKKYSELFELGIHPNFLPGSTHGKTEKEVMDHIMRILPQACTVRTHGLLQSGKLLHFICSNYPIRYDSSLFLPSTPYISKHSLNLGRSSLIRLPYFWGDFHSFSEAGGMIPFDKAILKSEGLKIFNFHPVQIALNAFSETDYAEYKEGKRILQTDLMKHLEDTRYGVFNYFHSLLNYVSGTGEAGTIFDLAQ